MSQKFGFSKSQLIRYCEGLNIEYYRRVFLKHQPHALMVTQEFGTIPTPLVGRSLIIENAAQHYCLSAEEKLRWSKLTMIPAFYPQSSLWRQQVLQKGIYLLQQSIHRTIQLSTPGSREDTTSTSSVDDESTITTTITEEESIVQPHDEL